MRNLRMNENRLCCFTGLNKEVNRQLCNLENSYQLQSCNCKHQNVKSSLDFWLSDSGISVFEFVFLLFSLSTLNTSA